MSPSGSGIEESVICPNSHAFSEYHSSTASPRTLILVSVKIFALKSISLPIIGCVAEIKTNSSDKATIISIKEKPFCLFILFILTPLCPR